MVSTFAGFNLRRFDKLWRLSGAEFCIRHNLIDGPQRSLNVGLDPKDATMTSSLDQSGMSIARALPVVASE